MVNSTSSSAICARRSVPAACHAAASRRRACSHLAWMSSGAPANSNSSRSSSHCSRIAQFSGPISPIAILSCSEVYPR